MGWLVRFLASGPARKALGLLLAALTIVLFMQNLRRAGERAARLADRLSTSEKPMKSNVRCWTPPAAVPLIVMPWLSACATHGSDHGSPCPPAVEYTTADQARAAAEFEAVPKGAMVVRMPSDYPSCATRCGPAGEIGPGVPLRSRRLALPAAARPARIMASRFQ